MIRQRRVQIADLDAQLAAATPHPDLEQVPPPSLARRMRSQDQPWSRALAAQHTANLRRTALERSVKFLKDAAVHLQRQVIAQTRRMEHLQAERDGIQARRSDIQVRQSRGKPSRAV